MYSMYRSIFSPVLASEKHLVKVPHLHSHFYCPQAVVGPPSVWSARSFSHVRVLAHVVQVARHLFACEDAFFSGAALSSGRRFGSSSSQVSDRLPMVLAARERSPPRLAAEDQPHEEASQPHSRRREVRTSSNFPALSDTQKTKRGICE